MSTLTRTVNPEVLTNLWAQVKSIESASFQVEKCLKSFGNGGCSEREWSDYTLYQLIVDKFDTALAHLETSSPLVKIEPPSEDEIKERVYAFTYLASSLERSTSAASATANSNDGKIYRELLKAVDKFCKLSARLHQDIGTFNY
jgi:hypothetical protein